MYAHHEESFRYNRFAIKIVQGAVDRRWNWTAIESCVQGNKELQKIYNCLQAKKRHEQVKKKRRIASKEQQKRKAQAARGNRKVPVTRAERKARRKRAAAAPRTV